MMLLQPEHIEALEQAEVLMFHSDFCPYLELKEIFREGTPQASKRFRILFTNYYGLNVGGLTDAFKDKYFEILFDSDLVVDDKPDYSSILTTLRKIPRKKGDYVLHLSFVSKLVAIHRESSPIYDRYVLKFFNAKTPATSISQEKRIEWYVKFLNDVANDYAKWANDQRIIPILERLKARDSRLGQCDVVRLMDFLVWKVGNQKLLYAKSC